MVEKEVCELKEQSDEELMTGFQEGNSVGFEKLVARYNTPLYRFIYRLLKDEGESQDLVQETFLRVYQNKSQYNPHYPFRTWIYSIASHLAINVLNSARRRRIISFFWNSSSHDGGQKAPLEEEVQDLRKNPEEEFSHRQACENMQKAMNKLSPRQKIALTLNKMEGASYKEIARIMDINLAAVESLIFRAKQKIHRELREKIQK
ncbi:MAG: RNA polymerase sigma factor [bacterium]